MLTSLSTLTKGEPRSDLGSRVVNEITNHLYIVTGHDHLLSSALGALWPVKGSSDIGCAQEKLRAIVVHERSVSTTLLLGEDLGVSNVKITKQLATLRFTHVDLGLEFPDRLHRSGGNEDHSTSELLTLHTAQQGTHVIPSLTTFELLVEHLDASQDGLEVGTVANNFDLRALCDDTSFYASSGDSTASGDGEDIYDAGSQKAGSTERIEFGILPSTGIKNGFSRSPGHKKGG